MFFKAVQVYAQEAPGNYAEVVDIITGLISLILPVLIGVGLLVFIWGGVSFMFAQGSEESVAIAKKRMFWGIIILFVMTSVWGILSFLVSGVFGFDFGIRFLPQ